MATDRMHVDGDDLREAMMRFADALELHREEIDSLNVFPVPDGDTGTNLFLTQRAVCDALRDADPGDLADVGRVVARAALMAARGNSGVILAQVLRGLTDRLCREPVADPAAFAEALGEASAEARRAVARPVEGTALTVLAGAAAAAARSAQAGAPVASIARAALEGARTASNGTREMLPELRAAGVVDAGGRGMVLLFDALSAVLSGTGLTEEVGPPGPVGHAEEAEPTRLEERYEVMYLWEGSEDGLPDLSRTLNDLGTSVVIVGGSGLYKAHVHTNSPQEAVAAAGRDAARDVVVVDLRSQVADRCVAGQARGVRLAERQATALVAVAEGDGVQEIFHSLGALVVDGGPGRNPSVGELIRAATEAPSDSVVVLPNHPNILPAAERAAAECEKDVRVVRAGSVVAGMSAAAAFNPTVSADENESAMSDAAGACVEIELTTAARDATTPAGPVRAGDWLGMVEDEIAATGTDPQEIAAKLVAAHRLPEHEILTLILGADASAEDGTGMRAALDGAASGLDVQVHRGGQPHYPYLIGLE